MYQDSFKYFYTFFATFACSLLSDILNLWNGPIFDWAGLLLVLLNFLTISYKEEREKKRILWTNEPQNLQKGAKKRWGLTI